ncbi:MAG TPA: glycosyltransferase family 2 protein [Anaeromyxobacter sp.]|nr:glycosyltransferase family 2 protein [Anaeromyxobacter sp.]
MASVPVLLAAAYLAGLAALSRRGPPPAPPAPALRFAVVVPAHDEEKGVAATVRSLLALDYPRELFRVRVVADNCRDATAARARAAGAEVLVRDDPSRAGKGHALAFAFGRVLAEGSADAVVVVDADATVSPNLLRAFSARLAAGAHAVQSENLVGNPDASWRTALLAVAFALIHTARSVARERLGLSSGLSGTGMCFTTALLRAVPHRAASLAEDLEYGISLALAGHRVAYAGEAWVRSDMSPTAAGGRSQRARWEDGRRRLARRHAPALLRRGFAARDPVLLDMGVDLLVPPLSTLGAIAAGGAAAAVAASAAAGTPLVAAATWSAAVACIAAYVARGWWISGTGARGARALLHAPVYLAWRLGVAWTRRFRPQDVWVRTTRDEGTS